MNKPKTPRGDLTADGGLLLYAAERRMLAEFPDAPILASALEDLGRLRHRHADSPDGDVEPMDELRDRVRAGIERQTKRVLEEFELSFRTTHTLKDLVASYVALGGDLELTAQVDGQEYLALQAELSDQARDRKALEVLADRLLDTIADLDAERFAGTAYDEHRAAIEDLALHRGRS